ncbi:MAG: LysR family transcriptional regulator [Eubacteriales bacterium]|nr:LysR family transcriptional regulator [Eubacteriales bacterium]
MNLSEIETFLTIVNTKSITKTAELLFLSQPTVSHRLRSLEDELGFPLIIRKKGHKQVELTTKGTEFITLAERWISLWKETQTLQLNQEQMFLIVGCTDSLNTALLAPLYRQILRKDYRMDLNIRTHQSSELYNLLNNHDIDIGFVYHHLHYKNIISERMYEEKLYLVQSDRPAIARPLVHTDELDASRELFLSWDNNFQIWHDRWLAASSRPHIAVDTITLMNRLWQDPTNWIIAPESAVIELSHYRPIYVSRLKNQPPNRVCYKITHRYPKLTSERAVSLFETLLDEFLSNRDIRIPIGQVFGKSLFYKDSLSSQSGETAFEEIDAI